MALGNRVPDMREPERRPPQRPAGPKPMGIIWPLIALAVLIGIIVWVFKAPSRSTQPHGPTGTQTQVKFNNLHVASGANGAQILQGTAQNLGSEPITGMDVTAEFTDGSGHIVRGTPETVQNADGSSLQSKPIPPGKSQDVQITLTGAPANWDNKPPELIVSAVNGTAGTTQGPATNAPAGGENQRPQ